MAPLCVVGIADKFLQNFTDIDSAIHVDEMNSTTKKQKKSIVGYPGH